MVVPDRPAAKSQRPDYVRRGCKECWGGDAPRPAGYAVMRYIQQVKRQERTEGLSDGKNSARWVTGRGRAN